MNEAQFLKYCYFYHGETLPPQSYTENEAYLWAAEKFVCENLAHQILNNNPSRIIEGYVINYAGKWSPFDINEIIQLYNDKKLND